MVYQKGHTPWNYKKTKHTDPRLKALGKKVAKANKGRRPWNYKKTKENDPIMKQISEKLMGHPSPRKGATLSDETKDKIRIARKGKYEGENNHMYGRQHTDSTRQEMRERWEERKQAGYKPWNFGEAKDTNPVVARSAEKQSIYMKEFSNRPEVRERLRTQAVQHRGKYPKTNTSIEILLQNALTNENITFKTDVPILDITRVDILIEPNICLFCDGNYWHKLPGKQEKDEKINQVLTENGYIVLRFWGSEIRETPDKCIKKILEYIKK